MGPTSKTGYPKISFRVGLGVGFSLGPGKIDLLDAIDTQGSISEAARSLGMSYRRAWLLVDDLNRGFGVDLVATALGGSTGGGASLTRAGAEVLKRYRAVATALDLAAAKDLQGLMRLAANVRMGPAKAKLHPPRPHLGRLSAKHGRKKAT
jgi:molybdate transport system regulatory protein